MGKKLCLLGLIIGVTGCGLTNSPLVYVSKQSLGVEVSANPYEGGNATLVIGFKNSDVAVVPTTVPISAGKTIGSIRGCYLLKKTPGEQSCSNRASDIYESAKEKANGQILAPNKSVSKSVNDALSVFGTFDGNFSSSFNGGGETPEILDETRSTLQEKVKEGDPAPIGKATPKTELEKAKAAKELEAAKELREAKEQEAVTIGNDVTKTAAERAKVAKELEEAKTREAVAIASNSTKPEEEKEGEEGKILTNKTKIKKGAATAFSVGKIFSTGVAAQHVAEGIGKGRMAAYMEAKASCIKNLSEVLGNLNIGTTTSGPHLELITKALSVCDSDS